MIPYTTSLIHLLSEPLQGLSQLQPAHMTVLQSETGTRLTDILQVLVEQRPALWCNWKFDSRDTLNISVCDLTILLCFGSVWPIFTVEWKFFPLFICDILWLYSLGVWTWTQWCVLEVGTQFICRWFSLTWMLVYRCTDKYRLLWLTVANSSVRKVTIGCPRSC